MDSKWKKVRLGDVIEFNPRERIVKGQLAKKIAMDKLKPFTKFIDSFEETEFKGGTKFRNGDTLFARITPCLENGKTSQVTILDDNEVGFGSTEYIVLREKEGISDKDYIYYLAISPFFRAVAIKSMVGSSGRQRVQQKVLEDMEYSLPDIQEQRRIVSILSSLDNKIENNSKICKNLEEIAQTLFKQWFVDFEFPNGEGKPYKSSDGEMVYCEELKKDIPKGWEVKGLDDIAEYLNGLAMQKYRPGENESSYSVLKIKELRQGVTNSESDICSRNIEKRYIIEDGDIIFSWSGSILLDIWCGGFCGLNQHLFKVTSNEYEKWFYYYWTNYHLERFVNIAKSKATTMGHIKRKDLSDSKVCIPTEDIYNKANSVLKPILEKLTKSKIESRRLSDLRDTLIPKLMSGELLVKDIEM